jgi:hypothetical protein
MKLEFEIDEEKLNQKISSQIIMEVNCRVKEKLLDDSMSELWEMVDKEIEAYTKTTEFEKIVKRTIKDSEGEIMKVVKDRISGNW